MLRSEHLADFEFPIGANHGIGIDRQVDRELPHRGKLIARAQRARGDPAQHLIDDLAVGRNAAALIQRELDASELSGFERHSKS